MDPTLARSAQEYASFLRRLLDAHMIGYCTDPKDIVTPFFVSKKSGALRIVWDCRAVNRRFKPCPSLNLASGAKWGDLTIDAADTIYVAQFDLANYFYHLGIPDELGKFFALPDIDVSVLREAVHAAYAYIHLRNWHCLPAYSWNPQLRTKSYDQS